MVTPEREAGDLEAMMRRMARALVRRAHAGDTTALEALARLEEFTAVAHAEALHVAHENMGGLYSWAELANALTTSRQAVRQRASRPRDRAVVSWLRSGLHRHCTRTHPAHVHVSPCGDFPECHADPPTCGHR